jgi:DNA polymerase I
MRIVLGHDGRAKKCIMFDGKSYVLMDYDDKVTIKGNTLTGRSNEGFVLRFIRDCIDHLLNDCPENIKGEYHKWKAMIEAQLMSVELVSKRQALGMSLEEYLNKTKSGQSKIAQYEAALSADRKYLKGDVIETWVEEPAPNEKGKIPNLSSYEKIRHVKGYNGNIDRKHYLSRLENTLKKFLVVFDYDTFTSYFPDVKLMKSDRNKLIDVYGIETFCSTFPKHKFTAKDREELTQEQLDYIDSL